MHLAQRSKRGGGEKEGRVVKSSKRTVRIAKHNKCARLLSPEGAVILDSRPRPLPPLLHRRCRRRPRRRLCPVRSIDRSMKFLSTKKQKHNLYPGKIRREHGQNRRASRLSNRKGYVNGLS